MRWDRAAVRGRDRTVITASNAMEYAFGEGELADTEVAPRCSPPLWWKGWRPGRPTATRTARWDWMSCMSMPGTRWGQPVILFCFRGAPLYRPGPRSGAATLLALAPAGGLVLPG